MNIVPIIDTESMPLAPSSKFISKDEYHQIYPKKLPIRLNFIFKYQAPIPVEDKVAKVLLRKYHTLKIQGKNTDLDDRLIMKKRTDLIGIAIKECGLAPRVAMKHKKAELITMIKNARMKSVEIKGVEG